MSVTSWIRRQFKDGVSITDTLVGNINNSALSFTLADGTTFPDGSIGPFVVTFDQGLTTEEHVLVASRSGAVFTVASGGRGYGNGPGASAHTSGASVLHTLNFQDLDEANQTMFQTLGQIAAKGDLLVGSAANTLTKLGIGAASQTLQVAAGTLSYVGFGSGRSQNVGSANSDGTDTTYARSDHAHSGATSVFGRNGAVTATSGDYTAAQVTNAADKSSGSTQTFTGNVTAPVITGLTDVSGPYITASGLTGATAASRYVGATASGAPTSGTFAVGDFVVDQLGCIHVCTSAGTPGTWSSPPMGALGYAQITANQTGVVSAVDVTGLTTTVTVGTGRRIKISAFCPEIQSAGSLAQDLYQWNLFEGATQLQIQEVVGDSGAFTQWIGTPSAGSHTYKVQANHVSGSNAGTVVAGATAPAYILVEDIGI